MGLWGAIKKAINSNLSIPLDKLLTEHGIQTFTEDGTFLVPPGVKRIWVTACGAGGGGGGAYDGKYASSGGGGGGGTLIVKEPFSVTPGEILVITIGKGGIGGTGPGNARGESGSAWDGGGNPGKGTDGGATVIGNLLTLPGGEGGYAGASLGDYIPGEGGNSGNGAGGGGTGYRNGGDSFLVELNRGTDGGSYEGESYYSTGGASPKGHGKGGLAGTNNGGGGGGGSYGNGGDGGAPGVNGADGTDGAGGGGAGEGNADVYVTGGKGGDGIVIIEW